MLVSVSQGVRLDIRSTICVRYVNNTLGTDCTDFGGVVRVANSGVPISPEMYSVQ